MLAENAGAEQRQTAKRRPAAMEQTARHNFHMNELPPTEPLKLNTVPERIQEVERIFDNGIDSLLAGHFNRTDEGQKIHAMFH